MKYRCNFISYLSFYINKITSKKNNKVETKQNNGGNTYKKVHNNLNHSQEAHSKRNIVSISKKRKKRRIAIVIALALLFAIFVSSLISYLQFGTANAVASGTGLILILATDETYFEIQKNPRIILAQSDNAWELFMSFMEQEGYVFIEEESIGGDCIFEKEGNRLMVTFSLNRFYSIWTWV